MRTKAEILADVRCLAKTINDIADTMGDCGGIQNAAVLASRPDLKTRLDGLAAEFKKAGYET